LDNGQVYLMGSNGITKHNEIIQFEEIAGLTTDVIYNVQTGTWDSLPYSQERNSHHLAIPYSGTVTFEHFAKTMSGENYAAWLAEWNQQRAESASNQTQANLEWSMFDIYISQAMNENGYYSYEVVEKIRIDTNFNGVGVYKVKVKQGTSGNSYYTGYLSIYLNPNGSYWKSTF
jgi:hypothetical protein